MSAGKNKVLGKFLRVSSMPLDVFQALLIAGGHPPPCPRPTFSSPPAVAAVDDARPPPARPSSSSTSPAVAAVEAFFFFFFFPRKKQHHTRVARRVNIQAPVAAPPTIDQSEKSKNPLPSPSARAASVSTVVAVRLDVEDAWYNTSGSYVGGCGNKVGWGAGGLVQGFRSTQQF